jgi:hypothetical protein
VLLAAVSVVVYIPHEVIITDQYTGTAMWR